MPMISRKSAFRMAAVTATCCLLVGASVMRTEADCTDPGFSWVHSFGNFNVEFGHAISIGPNGAVAAAGGFGSATLPPGSYQVNFNPAGSDVRTIAGAQDAFVTLLNADGSYAWTGDGGGMGMDEGVAAAVDSTGNVIVAGYFSDVANVALDPFDLEFGVATGGPADRDVFVTKLSGSGANLWSRTFGGIEFDEPRAVAVNAAGDIFVVGRFSGLAVDFDPTGGVDEHSSNGDVDGFVTKLAAGGSYGWTRTFGGALADEAAGVLVDSVGDVVVTGFFSDAVDFNPTSSGGEHSSNGMSDVFVLKLQGSNGAFVWSRAVGGSGADSGAALARDSSNGLVVAGEVSHDEGGIDLDPTPGIDVRATIGDRDIFLLKLGGDGSYAWSRLMGGVHQDLAISVAVNDAEKVAALGSVNGIAIGLGAGNDIVFEINGVEGDYSLLAVFDSAGSAIVAHRLEGMGQMQPGEGEPETGRLISLDMAVDSSGDLLLTGAISGAVDFDPDGPDGEAVSNGNLDAFVSKLACAFPADDLDGDTIIDANDVCPLLFDPSQADADGDGVGDVCDNCDQFNPNQAADFDQDGIPDACDECPNTSHLDLPRLYWVETGLNRVFRAEADGSCIMDAAPLLFVQGRAPRAAAVDRANGKLYVAEQVNGGFAARLWRANLDGSGFDDLDIRSNQAAASLPLLVEPTDLAVDPMGGKLYWIDRTTTDLQRANLDGTGVEQIVSGLNFPAGMEVDPSGGMVYWAEVGVQLIRRRSADGSGAVQDVISGVFWPSGIAVDAGAGKIYFTDLISDNIRRANLNGTQVEVLVTGLSIGERVELDLVNGMMYWTVSFQDNIRLANLNGSGVSPFLTQRDGPLGLALSIPAGTPLVLGDCDGSGLVDVADVPCVVDLLLGDPTPPGAEERSDVNQDTSNDGADIPGFVDLLAGGP